MRWTTLWQKGFVKIITQNYLSKHVHAYKAWVLLFLKLNNKTMGISTFRLSLPNKISFLITINITFKDSMVPRLEQDGHFLLSFENKIYTAAKLVTCHKIWQCLYILDAMYNIAIFVGMTSKSIALQNQEQVECVISIISYSWKIKCAFSFGKANFKATFLRLKNKRR